jgi:hypothetical protein
MSEGNFQDALHLILLGLGDLRTLHVQLAAAVNKRLVLIQKTGVLQRPSKEEVCVLARIDQLRCAIRQRCKDAAKIDGTLEKDRKALGDVVTTIGNLKEIDLTMGASS